MYIFDDNLNKNCPIAITFGTLITQTIGHRKVVSLSPQHLFNATIWSWIPQSTKNRQFRRKQHLVLQKTKANNNFSHLSSFNQSVRHTKLIMSARMSFEQRRWADAAPHWCLEWSAAERLWLGGQWAEKETESVLRAQGRHFENSL